MEPPWRGISGPARAAERREPDSRSLRTAFPLKLSSVSAPPVPWQGSAGPWRPTGSGGPSTQRKRRKSAPKFRTRKTRTPNCRASVAHGWNGAALVRRASRRQPAASQAPVQLRRSFLFRRARARRSESRRSEITSPMPAARRAASGHLGSRRSSASWRRSAAGGDFAARLGALGNIALAAAVDFSGFAWRRCRCLWSFLVPRRWAVRRASAERGFRAGGLSAPESALAVLLSAISSGR